jgi:hypothetical protein
MSVTSTPDVLLTPQLQDAVTVKGVRWNWGASHAVAMALSVASSTDTVTAVGNHTRNPTARENPPKENLTCTKSLPVVSEPVS